MKSITVFLSVYLLGSALSSVALAQSTGSGDATDLLRPWMSKDVGEAWKQGFKGAGTTITFVDDFRSKNFLRGKLGATSENLLHGQWTLKEASLIAPSADLTSQDFYSGTFVKLTSTGLNILNLSYAMYYRNGLDASKINWSQQESSIIDNAQNGLAVVSKAAGNDAVAIGRPNRSGYVDYLNTSLRGATSAIYVGALSKNGSTTAKASLAYYSNTAGTDLTTQKQFVVVGVENSKTGLVGTSFAAPVISGYAAILGSKFTGATPSDITNQLLSTARTDTVVNYNPATYGRGEASLSRALAPVTMK
jgi:subtilisin family serine protease